MAKKTKEIVKDSHMIASSVDEVMTESFGTYAKYVNQERSIPDLRDGLLPVQRRLLYSMHTMGWFSNKAHVKSTRPVAETMGKYHPHGDAAIYGALARLSKQWIVNEQLVDMDGNNGSIDGDPEAAARYTESRLAPYSEDLLLSNLSLKGIVPMKNNFDDTLQEPEYLPAKVPNVLINGSEGIAVGYASNIPTFNLTEVLNGCIAQIKKPNISAKEMEQYIPAPDFPTGGVISGYRGFGNVLEEGKGAYKVRGKFHVEDNGAKGYTIVFDEIPYGASKPNITKVLDEAIQNKQLSGVKEARDESGKDGLRYIIECDKDANLNAILGFLFTKTELQKNVPVNMTVISRSRPRHLGVAEIIREFNDFRYETFVRGLKIQVEDLEAKKHLAEGFILLVDNIEQVVEIIKNSENKADAKKNLLAVIPFSDIQIESILNMSLHRISKTDKNKHVTTVAECEKEIQFRETVLKDDKLIRQQLIKGYRNIIKKYGYERKTELIEEIENWNFDVVDVIPDEKVVVGIQRNGMVKRSSLRSYSTTEKVDMESLAAEIHTTTRKNIILIASNGKFLYLPVHKLPDLKWGEDGKHITTLGADLGANEFVFACEHDEENDEQLILIVKNNGLVKASKASDYVRTRGLFTFQDGIKKSDDEVIAAYSIDPSVENYLALRDSDGKDMYFEVSELSVTGLKTAGSKGISIKKGSGAVVVYSELFGNKEEIPEEIQYRERGSMGWHHKKSK